MSLAIAGATRATQHVVASSGLELGSRVIRLGIGFAEYTRIDTQALKINKCVCMYINMYIYTHTCMYMYM